MKKVIFAIVVLSLLTGMYYIGNSAFWNKLDEGEQGAVIGGGAGIVVGNTVAPGVGGTVVGGATGAAAGKALGDEISEDKKRLEEFYQDIKKNNPSLKD